MSKAADQAWQMLQEGKDYETIRITTGMSRAVLDAMSKDLARIQAETARRKARKEGRK